jgi:hypothetical protein
VAYDFSASTKYIHWGTIPLETYTSYTLSAWVRPEGTTNTGYVFGNWNANTGLYLRRWLTPTQWAWGSLDPGTLSDVGTVDVNVWQHLLFTFFDSGADGSCEGILYKNGSSISSKSTCFRMRASTNEFGVGNRADLLRDLDGQVAHFAKWDNTLLSPRDIAALAAGASPLLCSAPPSFYAPLDYGIDDIVGGVTGTNVGTVLADAQNPSIFYPGPHYNPSPQVPRYATLSCSAGATVAENALSGKNAVITLHNATWVA